MHMHIERVTIITPELLEAFERLIPQLTRAPIPAQSELEALIASSSILLIARFPEQSSPIVGAACLGVFRTPSGIHAHVEDVIVDEALRGKGIGEALVNALLDEAQSLGLKGVSLTCNPRREAANRLYQKMGFAAWHTNVYWFELSSRQRP